MQPKQFLKQIDLIEEEIQCNKQELEGLRALSTGITGGSSSDVKVSTSNQEGEARFASLIHKILELENSIIPDTEKALSLKLEVRSAISGLEKTNERLLLNYKYVQSMTWNEVCDKMDISDTTAYRLHGTALRNLKF